MNDFRSATASAVCALMLGLFASSPCLAEDPAPTPTPTPPAADAAAPASDAAPDAKPAAAATDHEALAKASQNPVAAMISIPFENNFYSDVGPSDKHANVLNIKPVVPVSISSNWNLINRVILPVIWMDGQDSITKGRGNADLGHLETFPGTSSKWGLGNTTYQGFLSPKNSGKIIWGVGPAFQFPTNTDDRFGADTWNGGLAAVALTMPGHWVIGGLVQQVWSFAKHGDAADVSSFLLQPFVNYNFGKGWYVSTAPVITANWEAGGGETWTVPLGGGIGKVMRFGKGLPPMNFKLAGYYNVHRPDNAPRWDLQLSVTLMFPK